MPLHISDVGGGRPNHRQHRGESLRWTFCDSTHSNNSWLAILNTRTHRESALPDAHPHWHDITWRGWVLARRPFTLMDHVGTIRVDETQGGDSGMTRSLLLEDSSTYKCHRSFNMI